MVEHHISKTDDGINRWTSLFISPTSKAIWAAILLMGIELYAAFSNGAYFLGPMTLSVTGAWAVLFFLLFADSDDYSYRHSRYDLIPIAILFLFVAWNGFSMFWSINRDLTWIEFNRSGGYLAVFIAGIYIGRRSLARNLISIMFVGVAAAIAIYAISVKIFPSLVTNTENLARISVPVGYTNAVGLLMALSLLLALGISARGDIQVFFRLLAVAGMPLFFVVLFFTVSRGSFIALAFGLVVYHLFSPLRLRSFGITVIALLPAMFVVWWGNEQEPLMKSKIELSERLIAASDLRLYLALSIFLTLTSFIIAIAIRMRAGFSSRAVRYTGYITLGAVVIVSILGSFYFVDSREPSFSEWTQQTLDSFTTKMDNDVVGIERVFSMSNANRWDLWNEAVSNWENHPIRGTGAQSFHLIHLINRYENTAFVKQPHGLPFRILSELGIVAFITMGAFIAYSLTLCTLVIYRIRDRWQKGLAASFLAVVVTYLIHTSYDWDWNMFALTMPYFLFTGILVGWYGSLRTQALPAATHQPACPELSAGAKYPRADRR